MTDPRQTRFAILHVMGPHSGRLADEILDYKIKDITERSAPFTFWAQHSYAAKPQHVRALCERGDVDLYLLANPRKHPQKYTYGGVQVKAKHCAATHYSTDDGEPREWHSKASLNLGPVEDNEKTLKAQRSYALVIGKLEPLDPPEPISLKYWADSRNNKPTQILFRQGKHVICAEQRDMTGYPQMKSFLRVTVAKARLIHPYSVWLRA